MRFTHSVVALLISLLTAFYLHADVNNAGIARYTSTNALQLGIIPRRSPGDTLKLFSPLVHYLEDKLNRPVNLVASKNYADFSEALYRGDFDLVHLNQYHYVKLTEKLPYEAIAQNEEFGLDSIRAAIYVRKDSGITDIQQLRGKTVSFGGSKQALVSYIVPSAMLSEAGLEKGRDYIEVIVKTPPNAILNSYMGLVDAACAGDIALDLPMIKNRVNTNKMRVLAFSEPLPHLPWAVRKDMEAESKQRIQDALIALSSTDNGKEILKSAVLTGLNPAKDSDYNSIRMFIANNE